MSVEHEPEKRWSWRRIASTVIIVTVLIQVLFGVAVYFAFDKWDERAGFGDMFGPVSTLFSALALAAVAVSIVLQSEELKLQRQEIAFNRKELQRSADAQVATVELFREQLEATQASLDEERQARRAASAPAFQLVDAYATDNHMDLRLINAGAPIREMVIYTKGPYGIAAPRPADVLPAGGELRVPVSYSVSAPDEVKFELAFVDTTGHSRRALVTCYVPQMVARMQDV
jgi:hypothetical protein